MKVFGIRIGRTRLVRMLADALMVQLALLTAFVLRFLIVGAQGNAGSMTRLSHHYTESYLRSFWVLAIVALGVFTAAGFYSNGRLYRGRLKWLWIVQMVSVMYAMFAAVAFLNQNWFELPRGVIPLGLVVTAVLIPAARAVSLVWANVLRSEGRLFERRSLDSIKVEHVLVIGGAGYIGSGVLPRLLERGYRVRLLDLLLFGTEPIKDILHHPNLEVVQADFRQIDRIVEAMRGVDAVIHLGGIVGDPACSVDEELTVDVNLTATRVIAEIARGVGVQRFIFASTCSVYGASSDTLSETSDLNPVSLYARTKLASETLLLQMASSEFAPVILRFGTIYGLSGRTRFDLVVNLLTAKAVREGKITVFGGDQWRPFVHVDDAAKAVFLSLEAPLTKVRNEIFNVGSDEQNYTIAQIGDIVASIVPEAKVLNMGSDTDKRNYRVTFKKIRDVLGFSPSWTLEQGIRQVETALRTGLVQNYTEARYSNVKSLTEEQNSKFFRPQPNWPYTLLAEEEERIARRESEKPAEPVRRPALSPN